MLSANRTDLFHKYANFFLDTGGKDPSPRVGPISKTTGHEVPSHPNPTKRGNC